MKNIFQKTAVFISMAGLIALHAPPASAQYESSLQCVSGYRQFLSSVIGYEGLEDYWKDIFVRSSNPCYYGDIRSLDSRIRRAREQVRSAFLRCDLHNLDNLTEAYHRLEAELYFLRHAVIKNDEGIFIFSRLQNPRDRRELEKEMKQFFVIDRGLISDTQMRNYLTIFEAKYEGRLDNYNSCRSDLYGDLETKFQDFLDQMKALASQFKKAFEDEPRRRGRAPTVTSGPETARRSLFDRLAGIIDAVEIEPQQSLEDLSHRLNPADELPTFTNVQRMLERESERAETSETRGLSLAKYEALYGHVSGDAISQILAKQDRLIEILKGTAPAMHEAGQCLANVSQKECQNEH